MEIKVLFHSNDGKRHCPDGFGAAFAAAKKFGNDAEYIPCVYGQPAPEIGIGDEVYLVDFSYAREVLLQMVQRTSELVVLDHHKTAQAHLETLHFAIFDMNRSGAQMAWEYFHPGVPIPAMIDYIADRDLWRKELPQTEEIHLALSAFPQDFMVWDTLASIPNYAQFMAAIGAPLLEKRQAEIKELAATADWADFGGHRVLATHTNRYDLVSDALNLICKECPETPFALNYFDGDAGRKCELRSIGDFDVSAIAKQFGGGGHKNAAGCVVNA